MSGCEFRDNGECWNCGCCADPDCCDDSDRCHRSQQAFAPLLRPAQPGDEVVLGCPACPWCSDVVTVKNEINGTWAAFHDLAADFRLHFDAMHRPIPNRFVRAGRSDKR